jgi:hypothetical protein
MIRLSLLIAAAAFGSDVGWQPLPDGGTEYIIQLNRNELDALRRGRQLESDIPRRAGEVRAYRILFGTGLLPHTSPPRPAYPSPWADTGSLSGSGASTVPWGAPAGVSTRGAGKSGQVSRAAGLAAEPPRLSGSAGAAAAGSPNSAGSTARQANRGAPPAAEPPGAWPWFTGALLLFASLGSNVYLAWIAVDLRRRCRRLMTGRSTATAH